MVPDLAADLVQRVGRPLDHVEGIQADGGIGAVLLDRDQDPLGTVTADVGELGAALVAEQLEEAVHHLATAPLSRPDQPATGVIDDQRQVALPSPPADLVDADPPQSIQTVVVPRGLVHHAADDPAHRLPVQPHQLATGLLRALRRQPRDLILEGPQVAAAVTRPRHLRDHHPVHVAGDPWCRRFDEKARVAHIQAAPAAATLALIVEGTATPTYPTSLPLTALRAHVRHHTPVWLLDQTLQHAVHHAEAPQPYTATRHVVRLLRVLI